MYRDDTALNQQHEFIDLARVVASVGHGDRHDGRRCMVDAVADGVSRPAAIVVDQHPELRMLLREASDRLDRRVIVGVDDDHDLGVGLDCGDDAFQPRKNIFALVVCGDHHGDAR
jgi:hypothetical protein